LADVHSTPEVFMRPRPGPIALLLAATLLPLGVAWSGRALAQERVDFTRDIQPILQASCYKCHSGAMRMGLLRLDARAAALEGGVSGPVILPGRSGQSEIIKRLTSTDPAARMPFKSEPLPAAQIDLIRRWIDEGAAWPESAKGAEAKTQKHWAYMKPSRPSPPAVRNRTWGRNEIDAFVLARLEKEGLSPAPEAARETLLRRVTLDLTGLPPTVAELDAFVGDKSLDAYDKVVDRLLASPRYGERWARPWLDLARYADSNGFDEDRIRVMWRFRDWVISAFNRDLPFDRFTIEQIAGDMLPGATVEQRIASGFHANTMLNEEGGVDGEEARFEVLVDRVNTTSAVWLGSTLGCAQCHNHKYDPFSQRDYYGMLAFFDNGVVDIDRRAGANAVRHDPKISLPTPEQEVSLRGLEREIAALQQRLETDTPEIAASRAQWASETRALLLSWRPVAARAVSTESGAKLERQRDDSFLATGPNPAKDRYTIAAKVPSSGVAALRLELMPDPKLPASGPCRGPNGDFALSVVRVWARPRSAREDVRVPVAKAVADGSVTGWTIAEAIDGKEDTGWSVSKRKDPTAILVLEKPMAGGRGAALRVELEHRTVHPQHGIGRFRLSTSSSGEAARTLDLPPAVREVLLARGAIRLDDPELRAYYRTVAPLLTPVRDEIAALKKKIDALGIATATVMQEQPGAGHPSTPLRKRGSFTSPGEAVPARVPATLQIDGSQPTNRLGLARWLVDRNNPLTARVAVNRFWEQLFGRGIVETSEDFGSQGATPSHPELLDWLAVEFMDRGWSVKKLLRTVVTSAAYRQSSRVTPELLERDPGNRLLARGPRFRMEAEMLRDSALAASGLLSARVGGPSVFPVQPNGIWNVSRSNLKWTTSTGEDRHRRSIYTFLRRSAPYPMFTTFDATSREFCTVRRVRTNTPLQALNLLNDPAFFEAAQALAARMVGEAGASPRARAAYGFRLVAARTPAGADLDEIVALYEAERARIEREGTAAKILDGFEAKPAADGDCVDLAAWTMVANVLINLDETQTKE
jgi:hypothetical protein